MLPARRRLLTARWVTAVVVTLAAYLLARATRSVFHDAPVFFSGEEGMRFWETARTSFARGDGFPLWDRTQCAGAPFLGNPQAGLLSAAFAGVFHVHGDAMARWYPTVASMLGVIGTYLWCRRALALGRVASLWAGGVFVASGFVSLQVAARMQYVPLLFIPWVLYLARLGERDLRAAAATGLVLALMVVEGGLVPALFALVALIACTIPRFFSRESGPWPTARLLLVALGAFVLLAGIKLAPTLVQLGRYPHKLVEHDALKWTDLLPMLIDKDRFDTLPGHAYHINEYRAYVGPLVSGMAIAGAGVAVILPPRRWSLFALLLAALLLVRGATSEGAPYVLLTRLPLFDLLQVPSRLVVLLSLAMAASGAVALDAALGLIGKRRLAALLVLAIAAVALWDPIVEGRKIHLANAGEPWLPRPDPPPAPFQLVPGDDYHRNAEYPARNVGALACFQPYGFEHPEGSGYAPGPRAQAWVDPPDAGAVGDARVTQNALDVTVRLERPGVVRINGSFDPDWSSDVGVLKRGASGMLELVLPAGTHHARLRYRPKGLWLGVLSTSLGALAFVALLLGPWVGRRARRATRPRVQSPPPPSRPDRDAHESARLAA